MTRYGILNPDSTAAVNMQQFDLSGFKSASKSSETDNKILFEDPDTGMEFVVRGTGFTFDATGKITGGTVTMIGVRGGPDYDTGIAVYQDFSLPLLQFGDYVKNNDWPGLRKALFSGNDEITGSNNADIFVLSDGGDDTVDNSVGGGNDTANFGAAFTAKDTVIGGLANFTTVDLDGNYSAGLKLADTTITNVSTLLFEPGFSYKITSADGNVAQYATLFVDAGDLEASDHLSFNGTAETDGAFYFTGGAGDDTLVGGAGDDTFDMSKGGNDIVKGGSGDDTFNFGGALNAKDQIDGGTGKNVLNLDGEYNQAMTITPKMLQNVQTINLAAGNNYRLTLGNGLIPTSGNLTISGAGLGAADLMAINAADLSAGMLTLVGGAGDDRLVGGDAYTIFDLSQGGDDRATGAANGYNIFKMGAAYTSKDIIDGGSSGTAKMDFNGNYAGGIVLNPANVSGINFLEFDGAYNYTVKVDNLFAPSSLIEGVNFLSTGTVVFQGQAETGGNYFITARSASVARITGGGGNDTMDAGNGDDTLVGGAGDDWLYGAGGRDTLTGGAGHDVFQYDYASESNQSGYDTITDFDWSQDQIILPSKVTGIADAGSADSLHDLPATFDASSLGVGEIALAKVGPSQAEFLIADMNGQAGYQPGQDLLVSLANSLGTPNLGAFTTLIELQAR